MKKNRNLMAFDLGASNGRAILGQFDGEKVTMHEIHRFDNPIIDLHGVSYWSTLGQYQNLKDALRKFSRVDAGKLDSFGIDTWGVDYGLLDKNGALLGNARSYRGATSEDVDAVHSVIPERKLYSHTGITSMNFNTIYQLYRRVHENDSALLSAENLLFTPDLLGYFLTGEKGSEYTISTTSALYNAQKGEWDKSLMEKLGIPAHIFGEIQKSGSLRGNLLPAIAEETGAGNAAFVAVGSHDTASAVAAIPGSGNFAFCSSGTWSLFGVETDAPELSDESFTAGFSNEGTVQGGFRPLRNIMGLWVIQECRREWLSEGTEAGWNDIVAAAKDAPPFRSLIDVDHNEFYSPGNMCGKIREYCRQTRQPIPESVGEISRCVYESLALKYRDGVNALETIKGKPLDSLNIVGGGIQNKLLNQMAASATGKPIITGPIEGAALGNILMQAVALGEISGLHELREVVRASVETEIYDPKDASLWEDAFGRLQGYQEIARN